jgi:hypothetical protein
MRCISIFPNASWEVVEDVMRLENYVCDETPPSPPLLESEPPPKHEPPVESASEPRSVPDSSPFKETKDDDRKKG